MSPSLTGGIIGLVLGLTVWGICQFAASRFERDGKGEQGKRTARHLRTLGLVALVLDIIVGYLFVGPALEGSM